MPNVDSNLAWLVPKGPIVSQTNLVGNHFTSWGDHEPLLACYNDMTKQGSVRLNKHRQQVQDLCFTDKYIPGKQNPTDYASRHPQGK